jgi:hypothetical protein
LNIGGADVLQGRIKRYLRDLFNIEEIEKTRKILEATIKLQEDSLRELGMSYTETLRLHYELATLELKLARFLGIGTY